MISMIVWSSRPLVFYCFFFFKDTATTEIYTLSLHDALPISPTELSPRYPSRPAQRFTLGRPLYRTRGPVAMGRLDRSCGAPSGRAEAYGEYPLGMPLKSSVTSASSM